MLHLVEILACNGQEVDVNVLAYEDEWAEKTQWEPLPEAISLTLPTSEFKELINGL